MQLINSDNNNNNNKQANDTNNQNSRTVTQVIWETWPDRGVPTKRKAGINLRNRILKFDKTSGGKGPVVIHCSAGIGRTGTVALLDICLGHLDVGTAALVVAEETRGLRRQRMHSVQTDQQYVYVHACLLDYIHSRWLMDLKNRQDHRQQSENDDAMQEQQLHDKKKKSSGKGGSGGGMHRLDVIAMDGMLEDTENQGLICSLTDEPKTNRRRSSFYKAFEQLAKPQTQAARNQQAKAGKGQPLVTN